MRAGSGAVTERELRAETVVDAPPEAVWAVLGDVRRMPELSPELVRMVPLKPGGLRPGQWYLGVNRRKGVLWATRNVVAEVVRCRRVVWDTPTSGARWIWELRAEGEGTRVVHRRPLPGPRPRLAALFAQSFLGGVSEHDDELEAGMARSVARLRAAAERRTGP